MGAYKGSWAVCIGFQGEQLPVISEAVAELKELYPDQTFRIYNSRFKQYTFLLITFVESRDLAHKVGLALIHNHLPQNPKLFYWVKEKKSVESVVKE